MFLEKNLGIVRRPPRAGVLRRFAVGKEAHLRFRLLVNRDTDKQLCVLPTDRRVSGVALVQRLIP